MTHQFTSLTYVNIELSSYCNKNCWMCGRRKIEKEHPELVNWGFMDFELVKKIANQLPDGVVVAFHNNGEPLLYPKLKDALSLFTRQIRCLDTNGKLLVEHSDALINNLDTLTVSVIENDLEADQQYRTVLQFLELKQDKSPLMIYRLLGNVKNVDRWYSLPGIKVTRTLHNPMGSHTYKKPPTIPEIGFCIEILTHLAIDRFGKVSCCVRFDPTGMGVIGDINTSSLLNIWNSDKRKQWIELHVKGKRNEISLCSKCEYYGVPTAY